ANEEISGEHQIFPSTADDFIIAGGGGGRWTVGMDWSGLARIGNYIGHADVVADSRSGAGREWQHTGDPNATEQWGVWNVGCICSVAVGPGSTRLAVQPRDRGR